MLKRGILLIFLLLFSLHVTVLAQTNDSLTDETLVDSDIDDDSNETEVDDEDDDDDLEDITEEDIESELGDGGAINAIDRFFDGIFGSEISNMRERFAEIRTLIKRGEIEEAKELLKEYKKYAERLEKDIAPEDRDEAVRLTRIIRKAIKQAEKSIPDEDRADFDFIEDEARKVGNAAKIAHKIKELCEDLHELGAWEEFERVCKTDNEGPKWQKDLYDDLTDEQKDEAKKFGEIMSLCMRTSGQECDCGAIPHEGMSAMCFEAAPLARACELEDNEEACDQLDELEFPDDLPEHLLLVMDRLENEFGDESYENRIPRECQEHFEREGIDERDENARDECMRIMIFESTNEIPDECRPALKEAFDAGERSEGKFRRICEEIMFEQHRPEECAGVDNPRDCASLFENEFRGEGRDDFRDGPNRGPDCKSLEDAEERLDCYDNIDNYYEDRFDENRGPDNGHFPEACRKAEAFDRESCETIMRSQGRERFEEIKERENQCRESCVGGRWDFSGGDCRCEFPDEDFRTDDYRIDDYDYRDEFREEYRDEYQDDYNDGYRDEYKDEYRDDSGFVDGSYGVDVDTSVPTEHDDDFNSGSGDDGTSSGSDEGSSSGGEEPSTSGITGAVIAPNDFFNYYYNPF